MLIITDKHTKEDLELWKEYEEADKIYYDSHDMAEKESKAIEIIKSFNPDYISISWGKDSVVLAHLCYMAGIYNYCHFTHKADAPYYSIVRDFFLKKYNINYEEIYKNIDIKINEFFEFHKNNISKIAQQKYGKKYITGIRIEESGKRKLTLKTYGIISKNRCSPLAFWKNKDIFAYLVKYNLPIHPNYAMLGNGRYKRERIRTGPLFMASQYGNETWEKEYYRDELNKLLII
jgi:phosphoadenosine phosphosulfate reductase